MPVGPVVLGLFLFLVIGSALFQILNSSMNAGIVEWKVQSILHSVSNQWFDGPCRGNLVNQITEIKQAACAWVSHYHEDEYKCTR